MIFHRVKGEKLYAYDFKTHIQRTTLPLKHGNWYSVEERKQTNMFSLGFWLSGANRCQSAILPSMIEKDRCWLGFEER